MDSHLNYISFSREQWAALRDQTPLLLTADELETKKGLNEIISLQEVEEVYLPLIRLIQMKQQAAVSQQESNDAFFKYKSPRKPFIIGLAGSVAVGKSTFARVLQTLLSRCGTRPTAQVVTTDGFLYSTEVLERKRLMDRKGFPESYDTKRLIDFMRSVKSGAETVEAPVYSHLTYDVLPDQVELIQQPDILIVEGINVLQVNKSRSVFVSDFFDFSIFLDAAESDLKQWYVDRFLLLQLTAFQNPESYFYRFNNLSRDMAIAKATEVWNTINAVNLQENILPTRQRANLILRKGEKHRIEQVLYRKF